MNDKEKLIEIFCEITETEKNNVHEGLLRAECEGWDSFNHLLLIAEIENRLGKTVKSTDIEKIKSFGDLTELIEKL